MRIIATLAAAFLVACAPAVPEPPPIVPVRVIEPVIHERAWTRGPGVEIEVGEAAPLVLPYAFQVLQLVGRDSAGLIVRCDRCPGRPAGYVAPGALVSLPLSPEIAASLGLADFALAIRQAAARRDLDSLRAVMSPDFTFGFIGEQSPDAAFAVWAAEGFASLDRVPELLDQGLAPAGDGIWSAPPAFVEDLAYRGLRLGFRKRDGRWEWVYLVRGIVG